MKRAFRIILALCLATVLVLGAVNASVALPAAPSGLVLWNKLGSEAEILNSEFGANGTIVGTAYAFEPAQHGNGYVRKAIWANYVMFPASVLDNLRERGAIELWVNPKVPNPQPYSYGIYGLIGGPYGFGWGVPDGCNVCLYWGDGVTGRGFSGEIRFDSQNASTPPEPAQFVATPFIPVHAAIVWDITGIDGTSDTIRVYRDGQIVGATSAVWNPAGADKRDILTGYGPDGRGYDKFIVDNLKIWDYAKTDFSDRFLEGFNQPPVAEANGPYSVAEGGTVALDGTGSTDPDAGDTLAYAWDLDGDGVYGETLPDALRGDEIGATPSFTAAGLDGPAIWTVSLRVTDNDGLFSDDAAEIAIDNVAPTVAAGPDQTTYEDTSVALAPASFTDPGVSDTHTATIDWGDGAVEAGTVDPATRTVPGNHVYPEPGIYTVIVTVTDDDGATSSDTLAITVRHGFLRTCGFAAHPLAGLNLGEGAVAECSLASNGRLDVMRQSKVTGDVTSLLDRAVLAEEARVGGDVMAASDVELRKKAQVAGNLTAGANARLKQDAAVAGDATAAGLVILEPGASVGGTISQGAAVPPMPPVTWPAVTLIAGGPDVIVAPRQSLALPPGVYGKLKVRDMAALTLSAGTYTFDQVLIGKQVTLNLDLSGGPILVDTVGAMDVVDRLQMTIVSAAGGPEQVLFRSTGSTVNLGPGGVYLGTFLAPRGGITVFADSKLIGALYGRTVWIHRNSRLVGRPAEALVTDLFVAP